MMAARWANASEPHVEEGKRRSTSVSRGPPSGLLSFLNPMLLRQTYNQGSVNPRVPSMPESLNGLIERVTFHNPENGFAVLKVVVKGAPTW